MSLTIKGIARLSGTNATAVSFVLNGKADKQVSASVQKAIRQVIRRHGYRRSAAAAGLRLPRSFQVAVCMVGAMSDYPLIGAASHHEMLSQGAQRLHDAGYGITLVQLEGLGEEQVRQLERIEADGLIFLDIKRPGFGKLRTARDSILRLSACFTIMQPRKRITSRHGYSVMGTKGSVETQRADCDKMKLRLPQDGHDRGPVQEMMWDHDHDNLPAEARSAGHEGVDYWPVRHVLDAVLNDVAPEMNVYKAAEAAAPAILAAESIPRDSHPLQVPDFRPGPQRQHGKLPEVDCVTQKN